MSLLFSLVQIVYWLSLSTWFGGVLFIAVAAPIVFRTVREANPILPTVLAVNLEGQHSTLLAGNIVGNLIAQLSKVELICAGGLLLGLGGHWAMTDLSGQNWLPPLVRSALFLAATGLVAYNMFWLWPAIRRHRDEYVEHADDPDTANPAREEFDRLHKESVTWLTVRLALLLGILLFSTTIQPARVIPVAPEGGASTR